MLARTLLNVLRSSGVKLEQPIEEGEDIGLHPDARKKAGVAGLSTTTG
jgi:hypothetical protein